MTKTYKVILTLGSDFQEQVYKNMIDIFLGVMKSTIEEKHKGNKLEIEIKTDNEKKKI